mmetsp:Transcript_77516/g.122396  ORF Transcript_77516/g.122396 Transcript_77516/m.122396 type:complete len:87 (-) Transcript_77516:43-303(-)
MTIDTIAIKGIEDVSATMMVIKQSDGGVLTMISREVDASGHIVGHWKFNANQFHAAGYQLWSVVAFQAVDQYRVAAAAARAVGRCK